MKRNFTQLSMIFPSFKNSRYWNAAFKSCLSFSLFFFGLQSICLAQPTVLGTDLPNGSYNTFDLNTVGGFKQYRLLATASQATGLWQWQYVSGTGASPTYVTTWRSYGAGLTLSGYNSFIPPVGGTASALYNTASGGQTAYLPAVTSGRYYTFNVTNNAAANNNMSVLETTYNPETITAVTQSPGPSGVTVTITTSAAPSANVYVRYSVDNFVTSSLILASFVGVTGTALIPLQPAGTTVRYYIYNSPKTSAQITTDVSSYGQSAHDMATLNLNNNASANYSYLVQPVTVNATNAANDATYATLAAAFTAINNGIHTGTIAVSILGNTTEFSSAVLNASGSGAASYGAISIKPVGNLARTITGNLATQLVDLNDADNVTIDGLNDGSGNTLTFTNSSTSAVAGTSTIRMYNGATANTVQNCNIEGSTLSTTDGVVTLGSGVNTTLSISNNNIRSIGGNLPVYGVYSSGTNTSVTISTNNIQDYFSATTSSAAVFANTACNTWTISNNKFFQTASRTVTTLGVVVRAIYVSAGGGHTISGNAIGYATSVGTGTTTYITTQADNRITPIELAGNTIASSIQGNVIANISITSASNLTGLTPSGIFSAIYLSSGAANIGTITGNTIGATTGTGSINITCSATGFSLFISGIYAVAASPNTVNIQNNNVGSINLVAASAAVQYQFYGIYVPATATASYSIAGNQIGSTSTANSIVVGTSSTNVTNFVGIASGTTGTVSTSGNTIQNCTVSGTGASSFLGISVAASTGALAITNNNIISCSNAGSLAFIPISNVSAVTTLNISGNIIRNNTITSGTCAFTAILNTGAVTSAITINNNQLGNASGGLITFGVANTVNHFGINNTGGTAAAALTIQSNDIRGIVHSVSGSGNHTFISNSAVTLSQNINTNTFTALSITTTGSVTFISNSVTLGATGTKIIKDNAIVTSFTKTGGGSNIYFYFDTGGSVAGANITNEGNNFSNITINGAIPVQGWFNTDGSGTVPVKNIFNNTFNNISANSSAIFPMQITNGTGGIYGNTITNCSAPNTVTGLAVTAGSFNIYSNTINTLSSSTSFAGVTGISIAGGTAQNIYYNTIHTLSSSALSTVVSAVTVSGGTTVRVYKNKIYGLSNSALLVSGGVYGISVSGGSTVFVYNNLVGNLTTPAANFDDAIRGISVGGGTTVNVYYNTVYINASSSGASFGSSALYANTTPTLDMRNNILYNISNPGASGRTVAYRRNGTSLINYAATSNNNFFLAGTPSATRLIFYDGTNSDQQLVANYQPRVAARDNASVTSVSLPFVSTTGSSLNFLHLNGSSSAESGGANIATFTDDYDDEIRQGNAGYTGTGTAPDIGADEFESVVCPATPTISSLSAAPYYAGDILTITGTNLSGITYATINDINVTIGVTTATTAQLTIPVTMADSVGIIQVAASSSCTFSSTFNFVFAGYITKGAGTGSGTWSTASIWRNNALPVANAPAIINTGDAVSLDIAADPIKFTILSGATFTHQTNAIVFGTTYINNTTVNGTLNIDNSVAPVLTTASRFISPKLIINSGGLFTNNSANAAAVTIANFYVNASGTYNHNAVGSTGAGVINDFPGSTLRSYGNTSTVMVTKWANGTAPSTGLPASGAPGWGNLTISVASLGGSWNQSGALTNVQGNLNIIATGGGTNEFRLTGNTATTLAIGGSLNISGGGFVGNTGSASPSISVGGNMNITGGYFTPCDNSGTSCTVNVTGNGILNGGNITSPGSGRTYIMSMANLSISSTSVFGLSASSSSALTLTTGSISISGDGSMGSTSSGPITINCTGNFSSTSTGAGAPATIANCAFAFFRSNTSGKAYILNLGGNFSVTGTGLFFGGSGSSPASINFTGGAASVTFTAAPSVMSVVTPTGCKNNFFVTSGKTLTLNNSIIPASTSSSNSWTFTVNTGATLDFGTNSVGEPALTNRLFVFTAQTGATLRTGHAGGVYDLTPGLASINTTVANASLSSGATYTFNGSSAQVTSAFTTTPTASTVANMVINNSTGVTLSASYDVTAALQMQTGNLTLSTFNLTTASITGAPFSNTKMVVTNSTGALGQPVALATIVFPVGRGTNYTPATYTFTVNSIARYLNVRAVTPRNSNDVSSTDYIDNRWWNTDLSVTTGSYAYTASYTFLAPDVVGNPANIKLNRWNGTAWVQDAASSITGLNLNSGSLNETTGTLAATAQWVGRVYAPPAIYTWTNPVNGSWLVPTNWTPNGVPGSGDGVIFNKVGAYTTNNMPTGINLTQFTVTNSTLTLQAGATAGTVTMTFPGTATPQFSIASGASMVIDGATAVNFTLPASCTGNVGGTLGLRGAVHRVTVATAGALVFPSGGYFYAGVIPATGFSGNPFGATGTNGAVIFQNASVCETFEGSNPFGNPGISIVTFQTGSLFRYSDPNPVTLPSASGRTYANFEYNSNKVANFTGAPSAFVCDDLTATVGTANIALEGTPGHAVKGNITIAAGATLSFSPDITTPTSGTVNMSKAGTQNISGAGTFNVNNLVTLNINAGTTASLQKNMGVNSTGNIAVNGTLILTGENYINTPTTAGGTVTLNNGGTLSIQSVNGISNTGVGNIRSTNFTYNNGGNFTYSGTANQVTGNRLPLTLSGTPLSLLTIANTGTAPNNVVTLTTNNTTTARINLNAGQFNAGTGGTLIINGGTNLVVDGGGDQFLSGTATDNIIRFAANGAVQGTPELYNVTIGTSGGGVDFTNNARINGILLINSGGFVNPNAPRYNTGSTLIYNTTGGYNRNIEWGNNSGLGNAGYPHHVSVQNGTTLNFLNTSTFDVGCGGNLTLGNTTAGALVLTDFVQPYDLFVSGNINIGGTAAGTLTMSNSIGCDLYLTGSWTRTATGNVNFGFGNGRSVYLEGSTDATITANNGQTFPYLRMQKAAKVTKVTLADNVNISFEASFTRGTLDLGTNNKFFSILSNVNVDGRVAESDSANMDFIYGASDNTGQFIVQRYMPARRAWRLVNAPLKIGGGTHTISQAWQEQGNGANGRDYTSASWVASVGADTVTASYGTLITGNTLASTGFDLSPNNASSIKFFAGAGTWSTPANTNATGVNSQEGWLLFVRGDRKNYGEITNQFKTPTVTTLRPRGQIFIGQKTLTSSGITTVGNPYASAVDFFAMTRTGAGWPVQPTYYVWDPSLGGSQGVGAFVTLTWNGTDFTRSSPYGAGGYDNRYIPSGAAIMVDYPAGGGTLSMNEANKNSDSTTTAFRPVRQQLMTVLQTKDADNSVYVADAALSLFDNNFNNDADVNDARKLSNINENICLKRNEGYLSIERKKLNADADTIFYFMSKMQRKSYQFKFIMNEIDVPHSTTAFLEDTYLKKKTPVSITDSTVVDFSIAAEAGSAATDRFMLVFRRSVTYTNINASILNSDVAVNWSVSNEWNIDNYEIERSVNGTSFSKIADQLSKGESDVSVNYNSLDESPIPGEYYYRIKSVSKNGVIAYSDVVKVKVVKSSPALYVFPNPVTNGTIQLQLNKAIAGTYSTILYGNNGQAINNEIINHAGGTSTKTIQPKQQLTSGTYQLKVTAPDNKVTVIKVVVVNE